jgi:PleD family two-component response regulator
VHAADEALYRAKQAGRNRVASGTSGTHGGVQA